LKICWVTAICLLLVPLLLRSYTVAITPIEHLSDVTEYIFDDGYYYLTLAANLVQSGRSSFDGISATNGYQPLWLMLLTIVAGLTSANLYGLFAAACVLIYTLAIGAPTIAVLWRPGPARNLMFCFGAGLALTLLQQDYVFLRGLEPILFAPLFMVLVLLLEGASARDPRTLRQISILLSISFLIRLDSLALYGALMAVSATEAAWQSRENPTLAVQSAAKVALRISSFVIPTVIAYGVINQWLFDSPVPVSGLAKQVGGPLFANWGAVITFWHSGAPIKLFLLIVVPMEWIVRRVGLRPAPWFYRSLLVCCLAISIQVFYYAAFSSWSVWPWYAYLVSAVLALVVARIIYLASLLYTAVPSPGLYTRFAAVAALALLGTWGAKQCFALSWTSLTPGMKAILQHRTPAPDDPDEDRLTTYNRVSLEMLRKFFPADRKTLIAMGDRSGGLAYWGHHQLSVVQTEGLLLDRGYIRALAQNTGSAYLERFPIEYLVTDREVIPTTKTDDGQTLYVVPDPVQGRVNYGPVPTFCFPVEAIRYRQTWTSWLHTRSERRAFQFSARVPCPAAAMSLVRSIETGIGLRQFSFPGEYDAAKGNVASKAAEDRDRRWALSRDARRGTLLGHQ
jgi:hypothetical protein